MKTNIIFYMNFIENFLDDKMHAEVFEQVFLYVFLTDKELGNNKEDYKILNRLFWAVEDFVVYPEIRNEQDLDEIQLKSVAASVLQELKSKYPAS